VIPGQVCPKVPSMLMQALHTSSAKQFVHLATYCRLPEYGVLLIPFFA
jgi:hypothetical protein